MRTDRISFLDIQFDRLTFEDVRKRLQATTKDSPYAYIVTPNVDHLVRLHQEPELRPLYEAADLCVCDSRILRFLAHMRGIRLPLVPGSDLTEAIFSQLIQPADRVAVIGSDRRSVQQLEAKFPRVSFLHFEAPTGLRKNAEARRSAAAFVARSNARFCFIAVGSPQQEMIAKQAGEYPDASGAALCIGAGLDFVLGHQKRAPRFLQRAGLEWAHRLVTNPRRLWRRYLVEGIRIFPIYFRWRKSDDRRTALTLSLAAATMLVSGVCLAVFTRHQRQAAQSVSLMLPPAVTQSVAAINALPPPNLLKPVSPQEAIQQNAQKPFVESADSPAGKFLLKTDAEDASRALTCLAQAVYYEAAGEGVAGGKAVAQVILNRVRHPGFPSTICGVVYEGADRPTGCQFSFTCDGSMHKTPIPWLWVRSKQIAEQALKGQVFAPVGHATHYHATYVLPYWADSLDKSVQIGRHIFYRLPSTLGQARAFSQHYGGTEPVIREPGSAFVMAPKAETQQFPENLTSDSQHGSPPVVQEASTFAGSRLLVDAREGTLLADRGKSLSRPLRSKPAAQCPRGDENKQVSPLKADDMRASIGSGEC